MKKKRKRNPDQSIVNQLSFDFSNNVPIEIHKPKHDISELRRELAWERRPMIEIVKS